MWSIGNEVGEADGSDKSVATVRRWSRLSRKWMQPAMSLWELINSALAMVQGGHEK